MAGLNVVLLAFTLLSRVLTPGAAPLSPGGMLTYLALTGVGFALGVTYVRYWPLPEGPFQRLIRMAIPAMGLALALAAFLGAQWRFGVLQAVTPKPAPRPPVSRQAARQSARSKR